MNLVGVGVQFSQGVPVPGQGRNSRILRVNIPQELSFGRGGAGVKAALMPCLAAAYSSSPAASGEFSRSRSHTASRRYSRAWAAWRAAFSLPGRLELTGLLRDELPHGFVGI